MFHFAEQIKRHSERQLRRLIYGATPKNVGNKVRVNDNPSTESQAYAWIELADYINLTATPAEGYAFTGWYDKNNQLLSTENPYSNHQLMTENTTLIYGQFEQEEQGIDQPTSDSSLKGRGKKLIKDGQLLIERNGKTYNAQGALMD